MIFHEKAKKRYAYKTKQEGEKRLIIYKEDIPFLDKHIKLNKKGKKD
jgi:hypothetical protein